MSRTSYDAIIIGAGQGGGPLAAALAGAGRKAALIEREHVGGTCINVGCTPTKAMVASARAAWLARRAPEYGVHTEAVRVEMAEVRARKDAIVASFRRSSENRIAATEHLDLIRGEARFIGPQHLAVDTANGRVEINSPIIVIDVGTRPAMPSLPGLDRIAALDSTSILDLDTLPDHLLILGGGYVGLEFAQMFRRFGSRVSVIQRGLRLLGREDQDVADAVADVLREDGIEIRLESDAVRVESGTSGEILLTIRAANEEETLTGSHLLVAIGRQPNTVSLGLEAAGIATDERGFILVNEKLESNVPGIYALGDVTGGPAFTHVSYDDYRVLRSNLIEDGKATTAGRLVPYTVFIDPQLGRVGLGEDEARSRGREVRVARLPMSSVARALEVGEPRGFLKAVVDSESELILGFCALGIEGGELMAMAQIAMMGGVPYSRLRDGIFSHPTLAESFNTLFSTLDP